MNSRVRLSLILLGVAAAATIVILTGVGPDPRTASAGPVGAAPKGTFLSDVATPAELRLWNSLGCVTCHGAEARGGPMAPDLTKVIPLYVAKFGSPEAAKARLVLYLVDPEGSEKLRQDGVTFPNPMPSILKLFGGSREDAATIAGLLVRLAK